MTWADVLTMSFFELKQTAQYGEVTLLENYPKLKRLYSAVREDSKVQSWLKIRPVTIK